MDQTLREAIEAFKLESYPNQWYGQPDEPEFRPVLELADPNVANGECDLIAAFFAEWLRELGIDAQLVDTDDVSEWGLVGVNRYGAPAVAYHAATQVGSLLIDWTAEQFPGDHEFPHIMEVPA